MKESISWKRKLEIGRNSVEQKRFCCQNYKLMMTFDKIPFESFQQHKEMYLKTLQTFMLRHEYLDYSIVYIYKISSRLSKSEITDILLRTKEFQGCILVLGIKKYLLIVSNELSNNIVRRLLIKSSFLKVSIHSAACIALNHLRYNRMPIFSTFNKPAFAKFLEVCFLFSESKYKYDNFKQYLSTVVCHNNYCRNVNI